VPAARASDDLPWAVTPESVASALPPVLMPPAAPPRRHTPPHAFRLLEQEEEERKKPAAKPRGGRRKRRGPWLKRAFVLLVLAALGAGGYWYFGMQNPKLLPAWLAKGTQLVSNLTKKSPPPPAAPRRTTRTTGGAPPPAAPVTATAPTAAPPPAPPPVQVPPPQPVATPFARYDRLSDSLSRAVRNFQDRARLFSNGQMDCGGLATGLVAVDNLWIRYNTERRARLASFDPPRVTRDQGLWAAVDSVSRRFDDSGCPRP